MTAEAPTDRDPSPYSAPTGRPWLVLAGCFVLATGFNAYVFAPASLMPQFVGAFGIDKPAAGLSISVVYLAWVLVQLPCGLAMDRYDNLTLVTLGAAVFLGTAVAGLFAPTYPLFLLTRFVGGVTAVALWTANAGVVSQSFPPAKRAVGTSLFVTSAPAGVTLAQALGPVAETVVGWRGVVVAYAVVALCGLPLLVRALDGPVRNGAGLSLSTFAAVLRDRRVLSIGLSSFSAYSLFVFLNSWMPTYATEVIGVTAGTAGAFAALLPAVGLLARPGGGWLSARIGDRRRPVIVAAFVLVIPALVAAAAARSAVWFAGALLLAGVGTQLGTGVFYVYVEEVAPPGSAGTSLSVLMTLSIAGSLIAPVTVGWLVDAVSWTAAFGFGCLLAVGGIVAVGLARPVT